MTKYNKTLPWQEGVVYLTPDAWNKAVDAVVKEHLRMFSECGERIAETIDQPLEAIKIDGVYQVMSDKDAEFIREHERLHAAMQQVYLARNT